MAGTMTNPENSSTVYFPDQGCGSLQNRGDSRHVRRAPYLAFQVSVLYSEKVALLERARYLY